MNLQTIKALPVWLAGTLLLLSVFGLQSRAQSYAVDWHKVAGGGGTSTGGAYQVSGTIGQHDASAAMTGGAYAMTGGFWTLVNVVQTPGLPNLLILRNGLNSVQLRWPDTGSYTLQQISNLTRTNWVATAFPITNGFGTNFCTITPPVGNLFFRLSNP